MIFLTGDTHANLINEVFIDRFADPVPIADEFVTGPVASSTFEEEILTQVGEPGLALFNALLSLVEIDCRHLDALSYALVEISAGTATVTLKDTMGTVLHDQLNPILPCTKTIGP